MPTETSVPLDLASLGAVRAEVVSRAAEYHCAITYEMQLAYEALRDLTNWLDARIAESQAALNAWLDTKVELTPAALEVAA